MVQAHGSHRRTYGDTKALDEREQSVELEPGQLVRPMRLDHAEAVLRSRLKTWLQR